MTEVPEHLLQAGPGGPGQGRGRRRLRPTMRRPKTGAVSADAEAAGSAATRPRRRSPSTICSSAASRPARAQAAAGDGEGGHRTRRTRGRRRGRGRPRRHPRVRSASGPGGHTQRLLTVVKSGSIQDVKAEAPWTRCTCGRTCWSSSSSRPCSVMAFTTDLLDLRERPAARAGQLQRDAQPVEGAVVLPRVCRSCSRCSTRWSPA